MFVLSTFVSVEMLLVLDFGEKKFRFNQPSIAIDDNMARSTNVSRKG